MPFQLEIIRATEFVRLGAEGHFDLAASKEALAALAHSCRKRDTNNAILDLRALEPGPKPVFTPQDLMELVDTFPRMGFDKKRFRLAILYRCDPHKRARLFSFLSTLHGWTVQAFANFEQALLWLSRQQEPATPSAPNLGRIRGSPALSDRRSDARKSGRSTVPRHGFKP